MDIIILKGGPCDGEIVTRVNDDCHIFRRYIKGPDARYEDSGTRDAYGRRIFNYAPLKPGAAERPTGVYNA